MMRAFRHLAPVAALASVLTSLMASSAAAREVSATEAQRGQTVRLGQGDRLRLTLPSNGTTGFTWTVVRMPPLLHWAAEGTEAPEAPPGVAGAEGRQILIFEAKRPGSGTLRLRYRQPWQGGMTSDRFVLRIEVGQ
jgi:predicted secreted protein